MQKLSLLFLILFLMSCTSEKKAHTVEEQIEEEFVPPPNPFRVKGPDSISTDSSKRAKRAKKPGLKAAEIQFEKEEYLFDSIEAANFRYSLYFKNIGERPLEINKVISSTNAKISWPNVLFAKEENGSIVYNMDLSKKSGNFTDTVRIYSNSENNEMILILKGKIVAQKSKN